MHRGDEFLKRFRQRSKFLERGPDSELWFPLSVATEVVEGVADEDLAVGAIEGVVYEPGKMQARIDLILDCHLGPLKDTWIEYRDNSNYWAKDFLTGHLRTIPGEVLVSLFIDTQEDWDEMRRKAGN